MTDAPDPLRTKRPTPPKSKPEAMRHEAESAIGPSAERVRPRAGDYQ